MTPDDDLTRRLRDLSAPPPLPLAGPAAAQARARQRGRRRTALLSGTAAAALLASGGVLFSALAADDRPDRLDSVAAPAVSSSPSSPSSPSPSPAATSPSPSPAATFPSPAPAAPFPSPSGAPAAGPTSPEPATPPPAPSAAPVWRLEDGFLSPQEATRAQGGSSSWELKDVPPTLGPLLDPCADASFPAASDIRQGAERSIETHQEIDGSALTQEVFRYSSAEASLAAFEGYVDRVQRCAAANDAGRESGPFPMEVRQLRAGDRLLVARGDCPAQDGEGVMPADCMWVSYRMVVRSGDGLTVAGYGTGEDGDPAEGAQELLDAIAAKLARTVR